MADWEEPCVEVTVYIKLELPAGKPDPRAGRVLGAVGEWASRPRFLSAFAPSSGASGLQVGGRPRGGKDLRWPKVRTPELEDSGLAGTPRGTAQRGWGHQFTGSSVLSPGATPLRESAFTSRAKHPSPCPALGLGGNLQTGPPSTYPMLRSSQGAGGGTPTPCPKYPGSRAPAVPSGREQPRQHKAWSGGTQGKAQALGSGGHELPLSLLSLGCHPRPT